MSAFPIDVTSDVFNDLRRRVVKRLSKTPPWQNDPTARDGLLQGLPVGGLVRDRTNAINDVNHIVDGLGRLGRLGQGRGAMPLCVLIDNARLQTDEGTDLDNELLDIQRGFKALYHGEIQPVLVPPPDNTLKEALVFGLQRDARLPVDFLQGALATTRRVARVLVPRRFDGKLDASIPHTFGTAWLIAPGLLMTNHHVVEARDKRPKAFGGLGESDATPADIDAQVATMEVYFDYFRDDAEAKATCTGAKVVALDPALDFALLDLGNQARALLGGRSTLALTRQPLPVLRGRRVNIVQHPQGREMRFAIRNNFLVGQGADTRFLRYQTDTEPGASGSPVCDDEWRVFALHHASVTVPPQVVPQESIDGKLASVIVLNEAIEIHAILDVVKSQAPRAHEAIAQANGWL